ncbi:MAG: carbon-nitrogen hydrolase family protein [Clostridia bacterium]|nr:carbon-nitrogen hydrolase family protein [Clostridia bacterium]MDH7573823.1 carbon-nitrogen hydrolase family protein [Clostridia bacterium]
MAFEAGLRAALLHAVLVRGDKERNLENLLSLAEAAARRGARLIVTPELALSGYSLFARAEMEPLAETVPGPATERFCELARGYGAYVVLGLAECDAASGLLYNSAVVIGPEGRILGKARKLAPAYRENLWSVRGNLPVLVTDTAYGRIGVLICADTFWYQPARLAALRGARLLVVPANWPSHSHPPEPFWRARALENGCYLLACNRSGVDGGLDCRWARSYLIGPDGSALDEFAAPEGGILYVTVPLAAGKIKSAPAEERLARRRPRFYRDAALDPYYGLDPGALLGLPEARPLAVAAVQFRPHPGDSSAARLEMARSVDRAAQEASRKGLELDLVVFPELAPTGPPASRDEAAILAEPVPGPGTELLGARAREHNLWVVWGVAERSPEGLFSTVVAQGPAGERVTYRKLHLSVADLSWASPGGEEFPVLDLPGARLGLLAGTDLWFPESTESLAKRGVDLVAVPAFWTEEETRFLWEARAVEHQVHLVVANQWGGEAGSGPAGRSLILAYHLYPERRQKYEAPAAGRALELAVLDPQATRAKRFLPGVDYAELLSLREAGPGPVEA